MGRIALSVGPGFCERMFQGWRLVLILLVMLLGILAVSYLVAQQVTGKAAEWQVRVPPIPIAFTGREKEIQRVVDVLVQEDVGIVSVTGGPGYGKSSVAIVSSHHLMKHGIPVCYVSLSEADSIETFIMTLMHALTRKAQRHPDKFQILSLLGLLKEKTVIVLDNADQLTLKRTELRQDFIKLLKRIVAESVYLHLVVVTRYRFKITSDFEEIHLQPLASPQALSLLRSLIRASRYDEELTEEQLLRIANETGGIPLAIKVVGQLVKSGALSFAEVVEELSIDPVSTLSEDSFTPDEQLKRCIDLSYKYLSPVGKKCFLFAACFPGSFDRQAARHIIANLTSDVHCLNQLVDRSLVEYSAVTKRYNVHALLCAFARNADVRSLSLEDYYQLYAKHYMDVLTEQVKRSKSSGNISSLYTTLVIDYHNFLHLFNILSANLASSVALKDEMELALETFETIQARFPRGALLGWWTRLLEDVCLTAASDCHTLVVQSLELSTKLAQLLSYHQKYSLARHILLSTSMCINRDNSLAQSFKTCQHPQLSIYITMLQVLGHVSEKEGALYDAHLCNETIHRCLREAPNMKAEEIIPDKFCSDGIGHVWEVYEKFKDLMSALQLFDALLKCRKSEAAKKINLIEDAFERHLAESLSLAEDMMAALRIAKRMYLVSNHEGQVKWLERVVEYMDNRVKGVDYLAFCAYFLLTRLYWLDLNDKQKALDNAKAAYATARNLSPTHDQVWQASVRLADILNQIDGHEEEAALYFQEALDHLPFINANPNFIYKYQHFIEANLVSLYFQLRQFSMFFQHYGQWANLKAVKTIKDARKILDLYYKMLCAEHAKSTSLAIVDNLWDWGLSLPSLNTVRQFLKNQTHNLAMQFVHGVFLFTLEVLYGVLYVLGLAYHLSYVCNKVVHVVPVPFALLSILYVALQLAFSFHYFLYVAIVKRKVWKPKHLSVLPTKLFHHPDIMLKLFVACEVISGLSYGIHFIELYLLSGQSHLLQTGLYHNASMDIDDEYVYSIAH